MAGNVNEFDDFFGDDEPDDVIDTKAEGRLLRVPLARMSPNLVNPRTEFGTQEALEDLGGSLRRQQMHALPVVTRAAYLKLWPDNADAIGDVDVVIVSGERRYRAALAVGLPGLDVIINDNRAASKKTFMDAVVSENFDRENFDPVEEAFAIDALVEAFGKAEDVAVHFKKSGGWVSQRRSLIYLDPEMQAKARVGEIPVEYARKLGSLVRRKQLTLEQQVAWWDAEQAARAEAAAAPRPPRREPETDPNEGASAEPEVFTAVKTPDPEPLMPPAEDATAAAKTNPASSAPDTPPLQASGADTSTAAKPAGGEQHPSVSPASTPDPAAVPPQRAEAGTAATHEDPPFDPAVWEGKTLADLPWDQAGEIRDILLHHMRPEIFLKVGRMLVASANVRP